METPWSVKAKDAVGIHAFSFFPLNKSIGHTLRHGRAETEKVRLDPSHPNDLNEALQNQGKSFGLLITNFIMSQLDACVH